MDNRSVVLGWASISFERSIKLLAIECLKKGTLGTSQEPKRD